MKGLASILAALVLASTVPAWTPQDDAAAQLACMAGGGSPEQCACILGRLKASAPNPKDLKDSHLDDAVKFCIPPAPREPLDHKPVWDA